MDVEDRSAAGGQRVPRWYAVAVPVLLLALVLVIALAEATAS